MHRRSRHLWTYWAAALASVSVAACSGAKAPASGRTPVNATAIPVPGGVAPRGPVIARVGNYIITRATLESRLAIEARAERPGMQIVPVPPAFSACVARLVAEADGSGDDRPHAPEGRLRDLCSRFYLKLLRNALGTLISADWVIGAAAEVGVSVTNVQVRRRLDSLKDTQFASESKFRAFLAHSGENLSDLLFNVQVAMLTQELRNKIQASGGTPSTARVAKYYVENKDRFVLAEQRDLGLIRTTSAAAARRLERELQSGTTFASVAKRLAAEQPIYMAAGLLSSLEPHVFAEKVLNNAIFSAKLHVITGPVRLDLARGFDSRDPRDIRDVDGYYVFEIESIRPRYQMTLTEVRALLTQQLPGILKKRALAAFVLGWRATWLAKTDCRSGYVVPKCREFKAADGPQSEDPYTLN